MSRIIVALGGNALGYQPAEQKEQVKKTAGLLIDLIQDGHQLLITHGNGPQVGLLHLAFVEGAAHHPNIMEMPFPECGAMSQGYIGFHLQQALQNELQKRGQTIPVTAIVTQVVVDQHDPLFLHPSKPIGSFYSKEQAAVIEQTKGYTMKEDAGRGYRRVIASPRPIEIVEIDAIRTLLAHNHIVISVGGGGIPVIRKNNTLEGVDAVIDKDFASSLLAQMVDADILLILTAVDQVAIDYNKPSEKRLSHLWVSEAKQYIKEGQFAKGSMLPKIEAALAFVEGYPNKKAIIASLGHAKDALAGTSGTVVEENK